MQLTKIKIAGGQVFFIYSDQLAAIFGKHGILKTARASEVEPTESGQWNADLHRIGGPILGPFNLRREALDAEVEWINNHYLSGAAKCR